MKEAKTQVGQKRRDRTSFRSKPCFGLLTRELCTGTLSTWTFDFSFLIASKYLSQDLWGEWLGWCRSWVIWVSWLMVWISMVSGNLGLLVNGMNIHGQKSLVGYSLLSCKEQQSDWAHTHRHHFNGSLHEWLSGFQLQLPAPACPSARFDAGHLMLKLQYFSHLT